MRALIALVLVLVTLGAWVALREPGPPDQPSAPPADTKPGDLAPRLRARNEIFGLAVDALRDGRHEDAARFLAAAEPGGPSAPTRRLLRVNAWLADGAGAHRDELRDALQQLARLDGDMWRVTGVVAWARETLARLPASEEPGR